MVLLCFLSACFGLSALKSPNGGITIDLGVMIMKREQAWKKYSQLPLCVGTSIAVDIFKKLYDASESGELQTDPNYFLDMLVKG